MEKKLTEILNEINFSATGKFEPSEIAKCIQAVEDKDERRIIAQAIIGDHALWLVNKMCETPSAGGVGDLKICRPRHIEVQQRQLRRKHHPPYMGTLGRALLGGVL